MCPYRGSPKSQAVAGFGLSARNRCGLRAQFFVGGCVSIPLSGSGIRPSLADRQPPRRCQRVRACWRRPLLLQSDPGFAGRHSARYQSAAVIVAPLAPTSSGPNCLGELACPVAQSNRYGRESGVCRTPQSVSAPRGFVNIGLRVRLLASACSLRRRRVTPLSRECLDRDREENFAAPSPGQFQ